MGAGGCRAVYAWFGCELLPMRYPGVVSGWIAGMEKVLKS